VLPAVNESDFCDELEEGWGRAGVQVDELAWRFDVETSGCVEVVYTFVVPRSEVSFLAWLCVCNSFILISQIKPSFDV
jgi:hypothetical protein